MEASKVIFSQLYFQSRDRLYSRAFRLFGGDFTLADEYLSEAFTLAFNNFSGFEPGKESFDDFVFRFLLSSIQSSHFKLPHPLLNDDSVPFSAECGRLLQQKMGIDLADVSYTPPRPEPVGAHDVLEQLKDPERRELLNSLVADDSSHAFPWSVVVLSSFTLLILFAVMGYLFAFRGLDDESVDVVWDEVLDEDDLSVNDLIDEFTESGDMIEEITDHDVQEELKVGADIETVDFDNAVILPVTVRSSDTHFVNVLSYYNFSDDVEVSTPRRNALFLRFFSYRREELLRVWSAELLQSLEGVELK
jgi:hypothetical protein